MCKGEKKKKIPSRIKSATLKSTLVIAGPQIELVCRQESAKTVSPLSATVCEMQSSPSKKQKAPVHLSGLKNGPSIPTDGEVASFYCPGCSQYCCLQFLSPPLLSHSPLIACASPLLPPHSLSLSLFFSEPLQVAALCQSELPFQLQTPHPSLFAFALEFLHLLCLSLFLSSHLLGLFHPLPTSLPL